MISIEQILIKILSRRIYEMFNIKKIKKIYQTKSECKIYIFAHLIAGSESVKVAYWISSNIAIAILAFSVLLPI